MARRRRTVNNARAGRRGGQGAPRGRHLSRDVNKPGGAPARQFHYFVCDNYMRRACRVACRWPGRRSKGE